MPHYLSDKDLEMWVSSSQSFRRATRGLRLDRAISDGYRLPKGSQVIGCTYAISRDESVYGTDVDSFRPERFEAATIGEAAARNMPAYGSPMFGYGRRLCPGLSVGTNSMFLTFATVCWGFDICPDAMFPIDVDDFSPTFVSHANPVSDAKSLLTSFSVPSLMLTRDRRSMAQFKCHIKPRSDKRAELMRATGAEARADLSVYE